MIKIDISNLLTLFHNIHHSIDKFYLGDGFIIVGSALSYSYTKPLYLWGVIEKHKEVYIYLVDVLTLCVIDRIRVSEVLPNHKLVYYSGYPPGYPSIGYKNIRDAYSKNITLVYIEENGGTSRLRVEYGSHPLANLSSIVLDIDDFMDEINEHPL